MVIYQAIFPNGKSYIGLTGDFSVRKRTHKHSAFTRLSKLPMASAIRKYGWDSIIWNILFETDNKELLAKKEQELIQKHNSQVPDGYNVTLGGEGTFGFTPHNKGKKAKSSTIAKLKEQNKTNMKKTILVDLKNKSYRVFDSIRDLSDFAKIDYSIAKTSRQRHARQFQYKILPYDVSLINENMYEDKPSHNAKEVSITNGTEIKKLNSINEIIKFLNISERKARNIVYKNSKINGWRLFNG